MSKRELETEPIRRSSRISSGRDATSSPAPRAITTRRSSANSISEKMNAETTASPMDKRRTRRTSTDEEPKPTTIRTRRSSVSKVIEEEKTAAPNSPSRRNTRLSTASPSLDGPARRTRRSSQDSETVEIPARRTTRRSSTGLQETAIEEIEKPKPITRRRRSASIEELEENVKVETKGKTRRLFNEDSQLEPIVEQDQEVKKEAVAEKNTPLGVIDELADEEGDKIMKSIDEVLEEGNESDSEKIESKTEEVIIDEKAKESIPSLEEDVEQQICIEEQKEESPEEKFGPEKAEEKQKEPNESKPLEEKSSPKKRPSLVSPRVSPRLNKSTTEDKPLIEEPKTESPEICNKSLTEEKMSENTSESPSSKKIVSPSKTPVAQSKNHVEVKIDDSVVLTVEEGNQLQEENVKEKIGMFFTSPGSDKENTSINISKKKISLGLLENKSGSDSDNVFITKKTPRNSMSICEPMDIDDDEDEVFTAETSTNAPTDKVMADEKVPEKSRHSLLSNGSPKAATCPEEINETIKDDSFAMHGSFSQLNSSPDKDSPKIEKADHVSPRRSSTLEVAKYPSTPISQDKNDSESETSIKLVDTDEEEDAKTKALLEREEDCGATKIVEVSGLDVDASILDKSFGSDKNQSLFEKISEKDDSADEMKEGCLMIEDTEDAKDAEDMGQLEHSQVKISPKRESLGEKNFDIEKNKDSEKCRVEENLIEESNNSVSLDKSSAESDQKTVEATATESVEIIKTPRISVINSPKMRKSLEKSRNDCSPGPMKIGKEEDRDSEKNASQIDDSKADISLVKAEKDSDSSVNETQNNISITGSVKTENETDANSTWNNSLAESSKSNDLEKSSAESSEDLIVDLASMEEKTDDGNVQKPVVDSPSRIILQSVKVIKPSEEGNNSIREKSSEKHSRISLSYGELSKTQEKADKEPNTPQTKTRHSLPNKVRGEQNIAKINRRISIAAMRVNEKSAKNIAETSRNSDKNKEDDELVEINIISSEDEDNTSLADSSTRKYSSIDSCDDEKIEKQVNSSITETPLSTKKRRSEGVVENKKTKTDTDKKAEDSEQVTAPSSTKKRRSEGVVEHKRTKSETPLSTKKRRSEGVFENKKTKTDTEEKDEDSEQVTAPSSTKKRRSEGVVEHKRTKTETPLSTKKRRSEGVVEDKRTKTGNEEKAEHSEQVTESKSPRRSKRNKKTIEILSRSGIDIEEDSEEEYHGGLTEFFDDEAEEGEDSVGEEDDENQIIDEGESVLSSDAVEEEASDDEYDPDDSFIDDEEQELLSGEEDFLGYGKKKKEKKKYKKIVEPTESSTSDDSNQVVVDDKEDSPAISDIEPIETEENNIEEPAKNNENEKSFEKFVDSVLKITPDDGNAPNETSTDETNSSMQAESSVILQETCSVGAAKSKILKNKINGVVDVFCQNITETEGNISLNVSLNYKPQNSLNTSMEKSNTETNNEHIFQSSFTIPSRLSSEKKKTSMSPNKSNRVENIESGEASSEHVVATPIKSPRLSKEKIRISPLPKIVVEEVLEDENQSGQPEIKESECEIAKTNKKSRRKKRSKVTQEKVTVTEESSSDNKKHEERTENETHSQIEHLKEKRISKERTDEKEESSERSDRKLKGKKRRKENVHNKDTEDEPKAEPKKKIRFDDKSQVIPVDTQSKSDKHSDDRKKNKDKKGKRKNSDSSDKEVPSKKRCVSSDVENKMLKEVKPTKSKHSKESKKLKNKHKIELAVTCSNEESDWEEEEIEMQPSAANTSVSGFNLEKLVAGDFKSRMIYDMSRNKRVKSKKYHKK